MHLQHVRQEKDLIAVLILVAANYDYKPHRGHFFNEISIGELTKNISLGLTTSDQSVVKIFLRFEVNFAAYRLF